MVLLMQSHAWLSILPATNCNFDQQRYAAHACEPLGQPACTFCCPQSMPLSPVWLHLRSNLIVQLPAACICYTPLHVVSACHTSYYNCLYAAIFPNSQDTKPDTMAATAVQYKQRDTKGLCLGHNHRLDSLDS